MFLDLLLITWIACAITGGVIASQRGREGLLGFVAGGIFGVFAIPMLFAMKRYPTAYEKRCDACAEIHRREALLCPHCGKTPKEAEEIKAAATG